MKHVTHLLCVTGFLAGFGLSDLAAANAVDDLHAFVSGTHTGRADFTQTVISKSGRKPQRSSGSMAFSRPGKFRWVYEKPYPQVIVGDGKKLWVYDEELNQVTVKILGNALGATPAALLAGGSAVEKEFELRDGGRSDGLAWVDAEPRAKEGSFSHLRVGFVDGVMKVMEIDDNFGQKTRVEFGAMQRNLALPSQLFHFVPPKGADVVGE